jgi:hypothetical protein
MPSYLVPIPLRVPYATSKYPCPLCKGATYRIRRRLADLFVSLFTPVHRYRCTQYCCHWEGNLGVRRESSPHP